MQSLQAVRGMNDLWGQQLDIIHSIEEKAKEVFSVYGFSEIRTPLLEEQSLFIKSVGEETDIVTKEMYTLQDRDDKWLCLRPENTAGVVRALIEHHFFSQEKTAKVYYLGPMFRRERPQKGRLRQFHQLGAEAFGSKEADVDVDLIAMLYSFLAKTGVKESRLMINTLGEPDERKEYIAAIVVFFADHMKNLCLECQRRLQRNPLRILDCKKESCVLLAQNAPPILDFLKEESQIHFDQVKQGLKQLNIPYEVCPTLVRGLDYYTRTVFEISAQGGLGAQNAIAAGGRYDGLVKSLGGPDVPAFGFAIGIERLSLVLQELSSWKNHSLKQADLVLIYADENGREKGKSLAYELRQKQIWVDFEYSRCSVKAQMRKADKMKAKAILVLGQNEIEQNSGKIKWLQTGQAKEVTLNSLAIISLLRQNPAMELG